MTRLKELEPEQEPSPEALQSDHEVESTVKEAVITGAPAQFISDRNRDLPQTPTGAPGSPLRGTKVAHSDTASPLVPESPSLCTLLYFRC